MTVVDVDRLVDDLADVVHGVVRAVACAADGTPLATSSGLPSAQALPFHFCRYRSKSVPVGPSRQPRCAPEPAE